MGLRAGGGQRASLRAERAELARLRQ